VLPSAEPKLHIQRSKRAKEIESTSSEERKKRDTTQNDQISDVQKNETIESAHSKKQATRPGGRGGPDEAQGKSVRPHTTGPVVKNVPLPATAGQRPSILVTDLSMQSPLKLLAVRAAVKSKTPLSPATQNKLSQKLQQKD
jgi:hypothetical protein